jgi:hypoxanthine phosphoribosyltransferase
MAQRILSWADVDALLEHLIPQFYGSYDAMLMISRGGIIPGGMIAERLNLGTLLTAAIQFPEEEPHELPSSIGDRILPPFPSPEPAGQKPILGLPSFRQFPADSLLHGRRTLVVHHVWNHGRTINAVAGRVEAAGGAPELCVLHYKPTRSIFPNLKPDYFAAITDDYIIYPWEVQHNITPYRPMPKPT